MIILLLYFIVNTHHCFDTASVADNERLEAEILTATVAPARVTAGHVIAIRTHILYYNNVDVFTAYCHHRCLCCCCCCSSVVFRSCGAERVQ